MATEFRTVGKPIRKVDAAAKCTGQTRYADDLTFPRMLWCVLLRSPHAHARIVSIDTSRAAALPGVHAVLTGRDMPIPFGILPVSQDEHALCVDRVRYIGDPVAAVAAIDEDTAREAVELIDVHYETLAPIMDYQSALSTRDPLIQSYGDKDNIHRLVALEFGDMDAGFAEADEIIETDYFYSGNTHLALEEHASVAVPEADGRVCLHSSTQTPHYVHRALAKVLEMPAAHIRVIAAPNGGGFGGKSDIFNHELVVTKLALLTGRPVKICLSREEIFYCHRGRHPVLMHVKAGAKKDGSITALHFRTLLDGGGYGSYGVASTYYTGALQTTTYRVPSYKFDGARVFTNKPPCGPKRGHGTPQPRFALEIHLDRVAERFGLDPAEIRRAHLAPAGSLTANYLRIGSMGLGACIDKVVEGSEWKQKHGKLPFGRGVGIACGSYISGAGLPIYWNNLPHTGVQLKLDRSGGVCVFCGETDIGQGSDSVLAQIVAEILGITTLDIRLVTSDTDLTPVDLGSYSSRVTLMMGNAAVQAAERARELLAKAVAAKLGVAETRIAFADRRVFDVERPEIGMTFAEAVQTAEAAFGTIGTVGSYSPPPSAGRFRGSGVGPSPAYSYSAAIAEVEVDAETGIVSVPKIWIAHDIGRSINPMLVIGQVEGGVYMGLGEALMEEQTFRANRNGLHRSPSMLDYKSPTLREMCEVVTYLVEDPDPNGPFGAKEVGQGPLLPVVPAIANAVFDAVGVRVDEVPITPEKVMKALAAKDRRYGPAGFPDVPYPEPVRVPAPWQGGDGRAAATPAERSAVK